MICTFHGFHIILSKTRVHILKYTQFPPNFTHPNKALMTKLYVLKTSDAARGLFMV